MSSKRKLVWVEFDDDGIPVLPTVATEAMSDVCRRINTTGGDETHEGWLEVFGAALNALPDALLVSEGDREALATLILAEWRPGEEVTQANAAADAILAAGYRKVTALDRETLVEDIARVLFDARVAMLASGFGNLGWNLPTWESADPDTVEGWRVESRALISRAEGTV